MQEEEEEEDEEEEEEAPRSRRKAEVAQEEDDDFDEDDEHMTAEGEFKCSTVVADGLPKGAGIPTEVIAPALLPSSHQPRLPAAWLSTTRRISHPYFVPCHHCMID